MIKNKDIIIGIIGILIIIILMLSAWLIKDKKKEEYNRHVPKLNIIREKLNKMLPYLSEDRRKKIERIKLQPDIKSYTINKHHVHLCLKDPKEPKMEKYYDNNILIYVTLHELAHIFCDEIGHTKKFFNIFNELIEIATHVKIYDPSIPLPKKYCGVKIP